MMTSEVRRPSSSEASGSFVSQFSPQTTPKADQRRSEQYILRHNRLKVVAKDEYRDLLIAAEHIKVLSKQISNLGYGLGGLAQQADSGRIERAIQDVQNLRHADATRRSVARSAEVMSQLLRNCFLVISGLLRRKSTLLLAAKVLRIARTLHRSLGEETDSPYFSETELRRWGRSIDSTHHRLVRRIDGFLYQSGQQSALMLRVLAALVLASNLTTMQVTEYFHTIRIRTMDNVFLNGPPCLETCKRALLLLIATSEQDQALETGNLDKLLAETGRQSMATDQEIAGIVELDIHTLIQRLPQSIRDSKSYQSEADGTFRERKPCQFPEQASGAFCTGVRGVLMSFKSIDQASELRNALLKTYATCSYRVSAVERVIEDAQKVIQEWIKDHVAAEARMLDSLTELVQTGLTGEGESSNRSACRTSLWDSIEDSIMVPEDADVLLQTLVRREGGHSPASHEVLERMDTIMSRIASIRKAVSQMQAGRTDATDVRNTDMRHNIDFEAIISRDRPQETAPLEPTSDLDRVLVAAVQELQAGLSALFEDELTKGLSGRKAGDLIRIERDISRRIRVLCSSVKWNLSEPRDRMLHLLVECTISEPISQLRRSYPASARSLAARKLWTGDPMKPSLPSLALFRFLTNLARSMTTAGPDLWTVAARIKLRHLVWETVIPILDQDIKPEKETAQGGHDTGLAVDELQQQYDRHYLRRAVGSGSGSSGDTGKVDNSPADEELASRAAAYWKHTHLLFSILDIKAIGTR